MNQHIPYLLIDLLVKIKDLILVPTKDHGDRTGRLIQRGRIGIRCRQEFLFLAAHQIDLRPDVVDQQQDQVYDNGESQHHSNRTCSSFWLTPVQDKVNVSIPFAGI